jgi:DNA uptake protein ComE-like DNA-binding protein
MSRFIKDYLSFSRSEKNALIILSIILILIILLNFFLPIFLIKDKQLSAQQLSELKQIQTILNDTSCKEGSSSSKRLRYKTNRNDSTQNEFDPDQQILFVFDPNTITSAELTKLGIPEKVINNILKYRQKGGKFFKKEDLGKIYGLDQKVYDKLEPYIIISGEARKVFPTKKPFATNNKFNTPPTLKIELNDATEADLDKLPSIGESFAKRIVKYRQMLGGYYTKQQLMEVYGFDSVRYNAISGLISIDESRIVKIAINLADIKLLGKHPYIGFKKAELIIERRNAKGPYKNIMELKEILGNATYIRLFPYLKLWD